MSIMMISKPYKLSLPILDRKLPSGWKDIIVYHYGKYRSIPNSKWNVERAIIYDKNGYEVHLYRRNEKPYVQTAKFSPNDDLTLIDILNDDYAYYSGLGYNVAVEFVNLKEDALPNIFELKEKLDDDLRVPLIAYVQNQLLTDDEYPQFNGHRTSAPQRKRAAPKKRAPAKKSCPVKVNFRGMI